MAAIRFHVDPDAEGFIGLMMDLEDLDLRIKQGLPVTLTEQVNMLLPLAHYPDDGPQMPADEARAIFRRFSRSDFSTAVEGLSAALAGANEAAVPPTNGRPLSEPSIMAPKRLRGSASFSQPNSGTSRRGTSRPAQPVATSG